MHRERAGRRPRHSQDGDHIRRNPRLCHLCRGSPRSRYAGSARPGSIIRRSRRMRRRDTLPPVRARHVRTGPFRSAMAYHRCNSSGPDPRSQGELQ